MQSETQTVRKDSSAHPSALKVRHQSAIDEAISVADDYKTFRVAVVIGLVMVGGLSLFLPDQAGRPTHNLMSPVSIESPDLAQNVSPISERPQTELALPAIEDTLKALTAQLHQMSEALPSNRDELKHALSTLSEQVHETEANIVELRQSSETSGHAEIQAQLATLAQAVRPLEVVKWQTRTRKVNPIVRTPSLQTEAMFERLKSQVEFRGLAGQADAVSLQR